MHALQQSMQDVGVQTVAGLVAENLGHFAAPSLFIQFLPGKADDAHFPGQTIGFFQVVHGGNQFVSGQITGCAEHDKGTGIQFDHFSLTS